MNFDAGEGLKNIQKMITTTPEFHSTGLVSESDNLRPTRTSPVQSEEPYKAVVFFSLAGGADTLNFLVPRSGCSKDMYGEYKSVRGELALDETLLLPIDATNSNQVCSSFGLHPNLKRLQSLYNANDLSFIANIGVLKEYATKDNWKDLTDYTALFSHNEQQREVQRQDIYDQQGGRGVGGRILDVLGAKGFKANGISTEGSKDALISNETPLLVLSSVDNYDKLDPMSSDKIGPEDDPDKFISKMKELNKSTKLGSNLLAETYSSILNSGLAENQLLYDALQNDMITTTFPETRIGKQLSTISTMMATRNIRGVDRDVFFVGRFK